MPLRLVPFTLRQEELLSTMALVQLPEFAALKGESLGELPLWPIGDESKPQTK